MSNAIMFWKFGSFLKNNELNSGAMTTAVLDKNPAFEADELLSPCKRNMNIENDEKPSIALCFNMPVVIFLNLYKRIKLTQRKAIAKR